MDNSTERQYDDILGRYLPTALVLGLKFSKQVISVGDVPYEGYTATMVDISPYDYKSLYLKNVKPK